MALYIYRNFTIEHLFDTTTRYSGYDEFKETPKSDEQLIWFYLFPLNISDKNALSLTENYLERLNFIISNTEKEQSILVFNLSKRLIQVKYENSKFILEEAIDFFNSTIKSLSHKNNRIKIMDIDSFFDAYSQDEIIDWKFYYLSKMIINPQLGASFKSWFQKKIDALNFKRKKCLILDLDNTIWGGVLGEEGIDGVKLGGDYPGNAFLDFQLLIKNAADKGVILAVCSKNNLSDVKEIWENHPEIILKEENFTTIKINWVDKAKNIIEIAKDLNIGLDSMVFVDDNPRERERVKSELPMVEVPDFPEEPYELVDFFKGIYSKYFQVYELTQEDITKTKQYKENANRNQYLSKMSSMDDYIKNLEIKLTLFVNKNIPRVAQMTQKTNQFNLTTKRYTESDLRKMVKNNNMLFSLGVSDKFGDSGITAAAIVKLNTNENSGVIDSFLLSCRILGKDIEKVFLKAIINLLYDKGTKKLLAKYIPTKKNGQTIKFYENNGFSLVKETKMGKDYLFEIKNRINIDDKYKLKLD